MKTAKKWMSLLLICLFAMMAAGCSGAGDDAGAVKAAEDYLMALKAGNAQEVAALESSDSESMVDGIESAGLGSLSGLGVSDENITLFKEALWKYIGTAFKSWSVKDSETDGDEAKVYVEVTGADLDALDDEDAIQNAMTETVTQWVSDNVNEMQDYAENHTEEEQAAWLIDQMMPLLCTGLEETAAALPDAARLYRISLVKEDGSWKVHNLEMEADEE